MAGEHEQAPSEALAEAPSSPSPSPVPSPGPGKPAGARSYQLAMSPSEILEQLIALPGVKAYTSNLLPDFGGLVEDAEYTVELISEREFTVHCGPPAARGQSATGMLRLLYLHGRLRPTDEGTSLELRFAYRRPRWALQRWIGFLALASVGLVWVLIGPGIMAKKALLYGLLVLVLGPVVAHDLRRAERIDEQRRALLNLFEHSFGPLELAEPHPDAPYRRRVLDKPRPEPVAAGRIPLDARRHAGDVDDDDDDDED